MLPFMRIRTCRNQRDRSRQSLRVPTYGPLVVYFQASGHGGRCVDYAHIQHRSESAGAHQDSGQR